MSEKINTVCQLINHGVYVIGVTDGVHSNAFTAAWVMQVSFKPVLLGLSINPKHYSYQLLQKNGICSVNVLGQHQYQLAAHFGRSGSSEKMAGFNWQIDRTGAPILSASLAYFDCEVSHYTDAGDHKIVVCQVIAASRLNEGTPLLYSQTATMDGSTELYSEDS